MHIAGVAFIDANQEGSHVLWPNPSWGDIERGVDFWAAIGVRGKVGVVGGGLTEEEWARMEEVTSTEGYAATAGREMAEYIPSQKALAQWRDFERIDDDPLFGDVPLCVLKAYTVSDHVKVYEEGVRRGNGSEELRREIRDKLAWYDEVDGRLQRQLLGLVRGGGRWVETRESGHWVHMMVPGVVAEVVRWVFEEVERRGREVGREAE